MRRPRSTLPASAVRSDGSFTLAPPLLQTLAGGALADGAHALHLETTDKAGNISRLDLSFILDTKIAPPSFDLGPAYDSEKTGDHATTVIPVTLQGSTDPNAQVTPLGADQTASGYEVAWKVTGADQYSVWATASSGSYTSNIVGAVPGTSSALEMLEPSFHQDLNGDGVIGLAVMSGGTVEVSSAYSGPATFMGSSGILQLDRSASFSGTVAGMTGQDTLDLRDISFATIQSPTYLGTSTGGTLSVSDGTHNAEIALLGNYLASTFVASSDGHGGTNVVDPSATDPPSIVSPSTIVKNFVTDFGAVGDGVTDDSPAVDRWLAWAQAQGASPVELYMPPLKYHFAGTNTLTAGLYNVTISGYGATVDALYIGTPNLLQDDFAHSARIQTVSAGATSVDLITPADASKFSVGQWVLVSGLELQGGSGGQPGYPPNFQFFEYKQIVNISGSVVTFASPLANSYESTWPVVDSLQGGAVNLGGPATIYALGPAFGAQQTILGLEVTANANNNGAVFMDAGLSLVLDGMKFDGLGPAPSVGQSVVIRNSYFGTINEIDKVLSYLEYDSDTGGQLLVQSAAPTTLVIKGSTFSTLNGTAQNTSIENSTIGVVKAGPLAFGVGESLSIINSSISTALEADLAINPSQVSFNNGTFRVATASPNVADVYAWAVPGHEYFFAFYDGSIHMTDDNGHVTTFKVLDVRQDATYTYVDTDLGATLPTPTFLGGRPANQYVAYPVMTAAETNSGLADFVSLIQPPNTPPVVTVSNLTANHGQSFAASSLFTASDPDGDSITQYGFWNLGTGGGHYVLNGVAQGTNREIDVSAAQLSQLSYQSGSGADTLSMRANDGTQWSAWSNPFMVTAPIDSGPVTTPVSSTVFLGHAHQSTIAASELFTTSESDGDTVAEYAFWDLGTGGGHFLVNGVAQGTQQEIDVAAAQLAQVTYQAGSSTDTLMVRANDGFVWGPWSQAFTVSSYKGGQPSFTVSDPTTIGAGETLKLTSAFSGEVSFTTPTGVLELFNSASFAGTVAGMSGQDTIDFVDIDPTKVQRPSYFGDVSGGTLTVTDGSDAANIALLGNYLASTFVTSSDGHGGTSVINQPTTMTDESWLVSPPRA
jgi:Tryptophan-rich Synechocystis species C-terminal domain